MPDSRQFDVRYLDNISLPFDRLTKELSDAPRIVDGADVWATVGGKLRRRPGTDDTGITAHTITKRPDRLILYETLENPPKVYLLASLYNSSSTFWEMHWLRLDAGSPAWTSMGTLRDLNKSTRPHEIVTARGLAYIKGYPGASDDKYGSVIFDGTGSTATYPWGIPGPTVPARMNVPGSWSASTNPVTVLFGWKYVYCLKSITGQYSNRSDLEFDPVYESSDTGAFTNKKPKIDVQGNTDTTNYPFIGMFRTTDGGGTFYFLEDITNSGAGTITYEDNHRVPGNTNNPKLDAQLDTSNIAPSLTTNTVPPPVGPSGTIGTSQVEPSSPIEYYAGRLWYFIGNRLYFSGNEEILNGVPEESWPNPNGIRGNCYIIKGQGRLLKATKQALYAITDKEVFAIQGQDRMNFRVVRLFSNLGAATNHPRAITADGERVFFLTADLQIAAVLGDNPPTILSANLGTELSSRITANSEVVLEMYNNDENLWLCVLVTDKTTSTNTVMFVFDFVKQFWNVPWSIRAGAVTSGRFRESVAERKLVFLTWNTGGSTGSLAVINPAVSTDAPSTGTFALNLTTNLFGVPEGNHINTLRKPAHHPMASYLMLDRTKFGSDTDPTVEYRLDEFSGSLTGVTGVDPLFTSQHTSYKTLWYPIQEVAQRVQLKISKSAANEAFELQNFGVVFQSEAGA